MAKNKILVVEDEPSIIKILTRRLQTSEYEVLTAFDGAEGLEKALAERPDLIISDIMMPRMDGYTFVKQLREHPDGVRIPVIILTAKEKMQDLFYFQGVRDCDYIVKPFETEALLAKITQLLARVKTYLEPGSQPSPDPGKPSS
jgi:two-component system alkaline phosphatase synthesis response regulator PhoP